MNKQSQNLKPIVAMEITREGCLQKRVMRIERDQQLTDTLLGALYPGVSVATVDIPVEPVDSFEQAQIELALNKLESGGVKYSLIGASGSAKNGKFYAVDAALEKQIAARFGHWPEAAITYFGILVSSCGKGLLDLPKAVVLVVPDHELGTNDCRGWIRRRVFSQFGLPDRCFYQFRLAFDQTQAKGSFKVMEDDVAALLGCDFVLPESSFKPGLPGASIAAQCLQWLKSSTPARRFEGRVVVGIEASGSLPRR